MEDNLHEKKMDKGSAIQTEFYELILLNDEINTFEHVMQCLMIICSFDSERAEQCTLLAHIRGQYALLSGNKEMLENIQQRLYEQNIQTKVVKK